VRLRIWKQRSLGLRVRLAISYTAAFTVVLLLMGLLIRARFESVVLTDTRSILDDESAALRKYVRVQGQGLEWEFDTTDNEEAFFARRLRRVISIVGPSGVPLEVSPAYESIGLNAADTQANSFPNQEAMFRIAHAPNGERFLLRHEIIRLGDQRCFVTLGRSLADSDAVLRSLTINYYLFLWPLCAALAWLGWWLAGRGLKPLNDVAKAAAEVNTSRLHTLIPMRGADDELDHLIGTFNSMTERLEISFTQMKHFSTDVSHELRTPLTTIRGQLEVALFTAKDEAQLREAIIGSIDEVDHLSKLVTALLQLAAAETGQLVVNLDPVDFGQIAGNIVSRFSEAADMENLRLKSACDAGCLVQGDRTQLERLVTNLVANAMKYTKAGGSVTVQVKRVNDDVVLTVQDTGRGIAPQHVPHIFDRFYRVAAPSGDPARGLGLGLSFVAWITKAHHGQIEVKSELGQGSTFRVSLPAYHPASNAGSSAGSHGSAYHGSRS
jgi:heavy metal sensor kinase